MEVRRADAHEIELDMSGEFIYMAGVPVPAASRAPAPAATEPRTKTRIGYIVATSWRWEVLVVGRYGASTCEDIKMWGEHD